MKKNFLLFIFIFLSNFLGYSQNSSDSPPSSKEPGIAKFYPLQLLTGEIRIGYEQPLFNKVSFEISPGYLFGLVDGEIDGDIGGTEGKNNLNTNYKGYALRVSAKFYPSSNQTGFYASPLFLYKHANATTYAFYYPYAPATQDVNMYAVQLLAGIKFKSKSKFSFDLYGGIGYKKSFDSYDFHQPNIPNNTGTNKATYYTLQLGCSIGYKILKG
jgi:hypothetical protein